MENGRERKFLVLFLSCFSRSRLFFQKKKKKKRGALPRGRVLLRRARDGQLHDPSRRARRCRGAVRRDFRFLFGGEREEERERRRGRDEKKKKKLTTKKKKLEKKKKLNSRFSASGHDLDTLLFSFLDELLFAFSTEGFAARELCVLGGIDRGAFSLEAVGKGERFDRERHASGTEVKAITYSAMRIVEGAEKDKGADVWVIVDI